MMKKIMFNDRYGLTEAVLEGRKTQTRRFVCVLLSPFRYVNGKRIQGDVLVDETIERCARYKIGEVVAIAQAYGDVKASRNFLEDAEYICKTKNTAGWKNKMFVKADLMPRHIKITNIRLERLQDISDEDCLKEGILDMPDPMNPLASIYTFSGSEEMFYSARKAYASLIDKVSGKGGWNKNPYVFVYDFELVD